MNLRYDTIPGELADEPPDLLVCFLCDADGPDVAASAEEAGDCQTEATAFCMDLMACMGRLAALAHGHREAPQTAELAGVAA
jgi:hypothetical protein